MSDLRKTLNESTKAAMRARDKERLGTLRMINAEFKRIEVDERRELTDEDIFAVLNKMVKQRQDAYSQYVDANRHDLAKIEAFELEVIQAFLPSKMDDDELSAFVSQLIEESGATGMQDMGKVMAALKSRGEGRVDMGIASAFVKAQLA